MERCKIGWVVVPGPLALEYRWGRREEKGMKTEQKQKQEIKKKKSRKRFLTFLG